MSVNADIRVPKIAELIAEQIQDDIAAGRLREGDGLPSEAAIMTSFGVCQRDSRALRAIEGGDTDGVMRI